MRSSPVARIHVEHTKPDAPLRDSVACGEHLPRRTATPADDWQAPRDRDVIHQRLRRGKLEWKDMSPLEVRFLNYIHEHYEKWLKSRSLN